LLEQGKEDIMCHIAVVARPCGGEQVEAYAHLSPTFEELGLEAADDLLRMDTFLLGPQRDRCAVLIAAGYHQHPIASKPVVAGEDVSGQVSPGQMT
jgi:hypothetical protein